MVWWFFFFFPSDLKTVFLAFVADKNQLFFGRGVWVGEILSSVSFAVGSESTEILERNSISRAVTPTAESPGICPVTRLSAQLEFAERLRGAAEVGITLPLPACLHCSVSILQPPSQQKG